MQDEKVKENVKNKRQSLEILLGCNNAENWSRYQYAGNETILQCDDVMKLDFGTHVDGNTHNIFFIQSCISMIILVISVCMF